MKLAFVFPGQGSQSVGMMQGWGERAEVRATFVEASDALGQDLWALVTDGPADLLNQTINTQPAMLAADVAAWRVWQAAGGAAPALLAGHSLGEYAALVAAGALNFADAIKLVRFRAEAMQAASLAPMPYKATASMAMAARINARLSWCGREKRPVGSSRLADRS